jgi:hypothetical protein
MDRKLLRPFAAAALFVVVLYCVLLWQPTRQVRLHQAHLLRAIEKRNWPRVAEFIAENYSDRWGHDKEFVLREAREVFHHFVFLTVKQEEQGARVESGQGTVVTRIILLGTGSPVADFAKQRLADLEEPFTFRWRQQSWKPWDWQLTGFDHPELEMPSLE